MPVTNDTQLSYFMDVVLRQYCRSAEENDILYEELEDMKDAFAVLLIENADLRFLLNQAGIEAPTPSFDDITNDCEPEK
jgi:hypothetical protein